MTPRMFPPGAPLSPTGLVIMANDGRHGHVRGKPRPPGTCTWCGGQVAPPRRSWCGAACVEAFRMTQPTHLVILVRRRDKGGRCEVCGEPGGYEVDHRVPIIEGGHPFDLANLRLLHPPCHRRETAALAGRRRGIAFAALLLTACPGKSSKPVPVPMEPWSSTTVIGQRTTYVSRWTARTGVTRSWHATPPGAFHPPPTAPDWGAAPQGQMRLLRLAFDLGEPRFDESQATDPVRGHVRPDPSRAR